MARCVRQSALSAIEDINEASDRLFDLVPSLKSGETTVNFIGNWIGLVSKSVQKLKCKCRTCNPKRNEDAEASADQVDQLETEDMETEVHGEEECDDASAQQQRKKMKREDKYSVTQFMQRCNTCHSDIVQSEMSTSYCCKACAALKSLKDESKQHRAAASDGFTRKTRSATASANDTDDSSVSDSMRISQHDAATAGSSASPSLAAASASSMKIEPSDSTTPVNQSEVASSTQSPMKSDQADFDDSAATHHPIVSYTGGSDGSAAVDGQSAMSGDISESDREDHLVPKKVEKKQIVRLRMAIKKALDAPDKPTSVQEVFERIQAMSNIGNLYSMIQKLDPNDSEKATAIWKNELEKHSDDEPLKFLNISLIIAYLRGSLLNRIENYKADRFPTDSGRSNADIALPTEEHIKYSRGYKYKLMLWHSFVERCPALLTMQCSYKTVCEAGKEFLESYLNSRLASQNAELPDAAGDAAAPSTPEHHSTMDQ